MYNIKECEYVAERVVGNFIKMRQNVLVSLITSVFYWFMSNNHQDIRRIDDSRQVKDTNGNIVGRQFYVIRRNEKGIQYGTWQPFQQVYQYKKALRSYYNRHPKLPYPNILADNDDEDFNPLETQKRNLNKSKNQSDIQPKPRGRPSKDSYRLNEASQQKIKEGKSKKQQQSKTSSLQKKSNQMPQVKGLFADGNEIIYVVFISNKYSYQNRKWVLQNCKESLIDFYESCMVLKDK